ncbi:MAG: hypothetical protein QM497_04060 [Sulfurimonas sp.]
MKRLLLSMAALPLVIGGLSVSASADDGVNILNNIVVKGEIRPRYESADTNSATKDAANAYTVRTHLVATAGLFEIPNLTATLGLQSVNNFGSDKYNSTRNGSAGTGDTQYDTIADPQQAMLSEASLDYKIDKTALHAGRSQVNLDNQRFIGTVGWRQNERSYDSVYLANSSIENLSVLAAWVYGFQGVAGSAVETTVDTNTVLLHANYKVMDELSITAYDYMISNVYDTYGLALTGKINLDAVKLNYRAEYAKQSDATMEIHTQTLTTGNADADYINLDLGANINGILAGVNYEVLSGASGTETAFGTLLGTNHKFNGWADHFLTTPSGGLKDANIRLGYKAKGFGKLLAIYHDFTADTAGTTLKPMNDVNGNTSDDLGSEFDVVYVNKIPGVKNLKGLVKYAAYSKGTVTGYTSDVDKFWLMLDYKFSTK